MQAGRQRGGQRRKELKISLIENCYVTGDVRGKNDVGGVGNLESGASISYCYASGAITGKWNVGGVLGTCNAFANKIISCVALNPNVTSPQRVGRVVGYAIGTLTNNWARSDMGTNGGGAFPDGNAPDNNFNGANCDAIPLQGWWATNAPGGPGWSSDIWNFTAGNLPTLKKN